MGAEPSVFAEIVSDIVSVDVLFYPPTDESTCWTLATSGMSDRPMRGPEASELYAELILALPKSWRVSPEAFEDEANYWPVGLLRRVARYPHEAGTALAPGQLLAFGDPAEPLDPAGRFNAVLIAFPVLLGDEAVDPVALADGREVRLLSVIPLRPSEYAFARQEGMDALFDAMADQADQDPIHELTEFLNVDRPDIV